MLKRYLLSLALMLGLAYDLLAQVPIDTKCCEESTQFGVDGDRCFYYCPFAEVLPSYRGGYDSLKADITRYLEYPSCGDIDYIGSVGIELIISNDGKVLQKTVIRGIECLEFCKFNEAALAVVEHLDKWVPAKCHNRTVTARLYIIVKFFR